MILWCGGVAKAAAPQELRPALIQHFCSHFCTSPALTQHHLTSVTSVGCVWKSMYVCMYRHLLQLGRGKVTPPMQRLTGSCFLVDKALA